MSDGDPLVCVYCAAPASFGHAAAACRRGAYESSRRAIQRGLLPWLPRAGCDGSHPPPCVDCAIVRARRSEPRLRSRYFSADQLAADPWRAIGTIAAMDARRRDHARAARRARLRRRWRALPAPITRSASARRLIAGAASRDDLDDIELMIEAWEQAKETRRR